MIDIEKIYDLFLSAGKISTDSRRIEKGDLFFALKGDNFNGNQYAKNALKKGASYAIIDEAKYAVNERTILVDNVLTCLQELSLFHRKKLGIPILAITGTNGKTTTKELAAAVLSHKFKVTYTQGNLNNHIGVPLTLLSMNAKTQFGIVEIGANHPGEIAMLCRIADPDYGIITNIGRAHLEGFGSFESIVKTKGELYDYIKQKNGTIFFNQDNSLLKTLSNKIDKRISYGLNQAYITGEPVLSPPYVHAKVFFPKGVLYLNTKLTGNYNFENILAATCIGSYFGVDPLEIQKAIKEYTPNNNRSQLIQKNKLKIIMDAYNANPTSMRASINSFSSNTGNKYMILGDMLELGKYSQKEHREILEFIQKKGFQNVFLVGKEFQETSKNFNYQSFQNVEELCAFLEKKEIKNGNILIKGSRGVKLEKVLDIFD